jgi:hypothetical protein
MVRKLRNGVGAVARVKKKFLHPAKDISDRYMNQDHNEELDGLLVLRKEQKRVNTREQTCVVFRHEDFDKEIYCVERWCKIVTEGPEESLFDNPRVDEEAPVVHDEPGVSVPVRTLGAEIREDIARFRSEGYDVDDDNDPAPENVPVPPPAAGQVQQQDSSLFGEWGATTLCHRRAEDRRFENPKLLKTRPDSRLGWLLYFLPMKYITTVLLVESSKVLPGKPLTLGEFIRFVGLWRATIELPFLSRQSPPLGRALHSG